MKSFYYSFVLKNITTALLSMFDNMVIQRYDTSGTLVKEVPVPIAFGPVLKYQQILQERETDFDSSLLTTSGATNNYWHKRYNQTFPRLALTLDGLQYNPDRACGVNETRYFYDTLLGLNETESMFSDGAPVPYDFNFTLWVKTESMNDFSQIVENILPYFNPTLYLRMKEFSFLNIERDIPVILISVSPEFVPSDQDEQTIREINGQVNFIVQGWMYKKLDSSGTNIIKIINSKYFIENTDGYTASLNISASTSAVNYDESINKSFIISWQNDNTLSGSDYSDILSLIKIEYSSDDGLTWNLITSSATNNGSYTWQTSTSESQEFLFKVSGQLDNNTMIDFSDVSATAILDSISLPFTSAIPSDFTTSGSDSGDNYYFAKEVYFNT